MPRGPADRPIRSRDDEVALQAAMRRALEQGAAPAESRPSGAEAPSFGASVAPAAAVRAAAPASRQRAVPPLPRVRPRKADRRESPTGEAAPDPRGRGGTVDLRL